MASEKQNKKWKKNNNKRKVASLSKNRDTKKTPQVAEDLSTPGTAISAHQCMVTPRLLPLRDNL